MTPDEMRDAVADGIRKAKADELKAEARMLAYYREHEPFGWWPWIFTVCCLALLAMCSG